MTDFLGLMNRRMAGDNPKGLQTITLWEGEVPDSVHKYAHLDRPAVMIHIGASQRLEVLDFRPFFGLRVQVEKRGQVPDERLMQVVDELMKVAANLIIGDTESDGMLIYSDGKLTFPEAK